MKQRNKNYGKSLTFATIFMLYIFTSNFCFSTKFIWWFVLDLFMHNKALVHICVLLSVVTRFITGRPKIFGAHCSGTQGLLIMPKITNIKTKIINIKIKYITKDIIVVNYTVIYHRHLLRCWQINGK